MKDKWELFLKSKGEKFILSAKDNSFSGDKYPSIHAYSTG